MHRFNKACDFASVIAFRDSVFSKVALQQIVYYDIRREFGLPAQLAIRAISRVVESYRADDTPPLPACSNHRPYTAGGRGGKNSPPILLNIGRHLCSISLRRKW